MTSNGDGQSADGFGCHPDEDGRHGQPLPRLPRLVEQRRRLGLHQLAGGLHRRVLVVVVQRIQARRRGQRAARLPGRRERQRVQGRRLRRPADRRAGGPAAARDPAGLRSSTTRRTASTPITRSSLRSFTTTRPSTTGRTWTCSGSNGTTVTSVGVLRNNIAYLDERPRPPGRHDERRPDQRRVQLMGRDPRPDGRRRRFQSTRSLRPPRAPRRYSPGGTRCCDGHDVLRRHGERARQRREPAGASVSPPRGETRRSSTRGSTSGLPYSGKAPDLGCFETGLAFDGSDGGASTSSSTSGSTAGGGGSTSGSAGASNSSGTGGGGTTTGGSASGGTSAGTGTNSGGASASASQESGSSGAEESNGSGSAAPGNGGGCSCHETGGRSGSGAASALAVVGLALAARRRRGAPRSRA